ncbi:thioredoxin fold domain-containing protein [Mucilaginibacter sp. PPCGB 2223]|uniref:TlpA family protein disulfide reductase n=1 Tax=Mucilaginibacter sp. PPCGB 2223 TaxID=1886027 RepID=UPI0009F72796|nr:thioredoxin fold domain-containing protein [Mucilaginibacter sp. PPCGB 2223]
MKRVLLLIAFIAGITTLKAQNTSNIVNIPPYKILTKDSAFVTPANLKKGKPVMIVYFSPDCTHCQHFTEELKSRMDAEKKKGTSIFRNTQIVMITFTAVLNMKLFYIDYELAKYPNIIMGTEGTTYTVLRYYSVKTTPYIAVYGKNGKLVQGFEKIPKLDDLEATIKKG